MMRWIFFIFIGYPLQLLMMTLYLIAIPLFRIFIVKKNYLSRHNIEPIVVKEAHFQTRDDGVFLNNHDDHGAFTHIYYWMQNTDYWLEGLLRLSRDGKLFRRSVENNGYNFRVSGDVVVFWTWAATLYLKKNTYNFLLKKEINEVAKTYLKNLGMPSALEGERYGVSTRCSNFGVNLARDGFLGLSQPAFGPQFYTSQALFELAAHACGWRWKIVCILHWIFMGGWLWRIEPVMFLPSNELGYVRDVTMKALHSISLCKNRLVKKPMERIAYGIARVRNPLFFACLGKLSAYDYDSLPKSINPWFSQTVDCLNGEEPSTNAYVKRSLSVIDNMSHMLFFR